MKKMMIASAIAFSALAGVCDVASQNVVGYQNTDTTAAGAGSMMYSSSFINIAGGSENKINLCDLKVARAGSGSSYYVSGGVVLQLLNNNGTTKASYYWYYNRTHGDKSGTEGWYTTVSGAADSLVTPESGIEFNAGDGFWLTGGQKLVTSSGAVLTGTQVDVDTTAAGAGSMIVANPYPVAVDLADITVARDGSGSTYYISGAVVAQVLNNNGTTKESYYWYYNRTHGDKSGTEGWYTTVSGAADTLVTKASNIKLQPSEGYWVTGNSKTIKFPALNIQ